MKHFRKKILITILLISNIYLVGCSVNNNLTVNEIESKMSKSTTFDNMEKGDSKSLKRFYKLNIKDYDGVVIYTPKSTMDVTEMLIVKVKDKSQIDSLIDAIDSRINYQLESFAGYGPEQCALVNDYELKTKGDYVFFAVSKDAKKLKESFVDSIKE